MHFQGPPSPFQVSAAFLAAKRGAESAHPTGPTPADVEEVTKPPAAPRDVPQPAGVRPVKRKRSMDGGNTPVEQVLRAAAANLRFSDCPPEQRSPWHTFVFTCNKWALTGTCISSVR
ncbi:unnamed protein product [Ixodes pacificus]